MRARQSPWNFKVKPGKERKKEKQVFHISPLRQDGQGVRTVRRRVGVLARDDLLDHPMGRRFHADRVKLDTVVECV